MSDKPRNPNRDDWDDDLDLGSWNRSGSSPRRLSREPAPQSPGRRSESSSYDFDDSEFDGSDPYRAPRPSRQTGGQDRYGTGRYPSRAPEQESGERGPGTAPRQPVSRDRYDYDEYPEQPVRRSTATRAPAVRPGYPPAQYDEELEEYPAAPRERRARTRAAGRQRPAVVIPRPGVDDGVVVGGIVLSLLSLVLMIATIAAGAGDLPDWFPIHLDASGDADLWGDSSTLWRIPFGVFMAMAMSLVIAIFMWKRDRFAARFVVVGSALVQVLAWVAVVDFVW